MVIYDKEDQKGKAAFNKATPHDPETSTSAKEHKQKQSRAQGRVHTC
jgi:hypothetical protein